MKNIMSFSRLTEDLLVAIVAFGGLLNFGLQQKHHQPIFHLMAAHEMLGKTVFLAAGQEHCLSCYFPSPRHQDHGTKPFLRVPPWQLKIQWFPKKPSGSVAFVRAHVICSTMLLPATSCLGGKDASRIFAGTWVNVIVHQGGCHQHLTKEPGVYVSPMILSAEVL
jgi:hypothetical protein